MKIRDLSYAAMKPAVELSAHVFLFIFFSALFQVLFMIFNSLLNELLFGFDSINNDVLYFLLLFFWHIIH